MFYPTLFLRLYKLIVSISLCMRWSLQPVLDFLGGQTVADMNSNAAVRGKEYGRSCSQPNSTFYSLVSHAIYTSGKTIFIGGRCPKGKQLQQLNIGKILIKVGNVWQLQHHCKELPFLARNIYYSNSATFFFYHLSYYEHSLQALPEVRFRRKICTSSSNKYSLHFGMLGKIKLSAVFFL